MKHLLLLLALLPLATKAQVRQPLPNGICIGGGYGYALIPLEKYANGGCYGFTFTHQMKKDTIGFPRMQLQLGLEGTPFPYQNKDTLYHYGLMTAGWSSLFSRLMLSNTVDPKLKLFAFGEGGISAFPPQEKDDFKNSFLGISYAGLGLGFHYQWMIAEWGFYHHWANLTTTGSDYFRENIAAIGYFRTAKINVQIDAVRWYWAGKHPGALNLGFYGDWANQYHSFNNERLLTIGVRMDLRFPDKDPSSIKEAICEHDVKKTPKAPKAPKG